MDQANQTNKVAHFGDPSQRKSNQHACGAGMKRGDSIAYAKAGGDAERVNVTCPDCNRIIQDLECKSVLYGLQTMMEQEKIEKKYYKKNKR